MSLFPAYGESGGGAGAAGAEAGGCEQPMALSSSEEDAGESLSPEAERALLEPPPPPAPAPAPAPAAPPSSHFYVDRKLDRGNLRVSTLYYPARPEYRAAEWRAVGTGRGWPAQGSKRAKGKRYWRRALPGGPGDAARAGQELLQRRSGYRRALQQDPANEPLWLQYIDFLECCSEAEGGGPAAAAEAAAEALKGAGAGGGGLPARYHAALRRAMQPAQLADRLADMRGQERSACARGELWAREVSARACAGGAAAVRGAAAGAARDRLARSHYHNPLLVYAMVLRSADLWEEATQLVELSASVLLGPGGPGGALPPASAHPGSDADQQLEDWEQKTINSGLPLNEVWPRVERARSRLQWRPAPHAPALALAADPQRAPPPPTDLLVPAAGGSADFRMVVSLLRAAEAPLLPAAHYVQAACAGGAAAAQVVSEWECALGVALLALLRSARRLPPAHPARARLAPAAARALLAHTPLRAAHALTHTDTTGWSAWRQAVWERALEAAGGRARAALLCWRLRELHTHALLAQGNEACVRAARVSAREALKRWAGPEGGALPFAVFARLEAVAGSAGRGLRAALAAARQAKNEPVHEQLYIARVVHELAPPARAAGRWALCCAAAGRALPPEEQLCKPVPADLLIEARAQCELRCAQLEERYAGGGGGQGEEGEGEWGGAGAVDALLPGGAEWGAARAALAGPGERGALLHKLNQASGWRGWQAARWREQCACALVAAGGGGGAGAALAAELQHLAPLNAYLALMSSSPVAAWPRAGTRAEGRLAPLAPPRCELRVWAGLLPAALAAAHTHFAPTERRVLLGACERALRGGGGGGGAGCAGGALLHALRLEAHPAPRAAALTALAHAPHSKWVQWVCAALGAVPPHALCDLALERGLRLRALPEELAPIHPPHPPHPPRPPAGDGDHTTSEHHTIHN